MPVECAPDAALLALGERLVAANTAWRAAAEQHDALLEIFDAVETPVPANLFCRADDRDLCWRFATMIGDAFGSSDVNDVRAALASGLETVGSRWKAHAEERGAQIIAAWATWIQALDALSDRIGLTAADAEAERLYEAVIDLEREIANTVPRTLAGLKVKAAALLADGGAARPLVTDILNLGAVLDEEPGVATVVVRLAAIRLRRLSGADLPMAAE